MRLRRFLITLLIALLGTIALVRLFQGSSWREIPQVMGMGPNGPTEEEIASGRNILPDLRKSRPQQEFAPAIADQESPYPAGVPKAPGSNYTRALVVASMKEEDTTWVKRQLRDMIEGSLLSPRVYVVDDKKAALRPPKNKGHEVMVYLTYIIDNYDELPDISIFMHAHQYAWHNNEVLDEDAVQMVRYLSPERVTREGYMNLRCHWYPGCPDWLHPGATVRDLEKKEEIVLANSWAQVFPKDPIPMILAQPCCAQFAVSRERILAIPKQRYIFLRDWIARTPLSDYLSGRVFEYTWQFIFTGTTVSCPSISACYCDGYGLCFGSDSAVNQFLDMRYDLEDYIEQLRVWRHHAEEIANLKAISKNGKIPEDAVLRVPEVGKDVVLEQKIAELEAELKDRRKKAFERGRDPKQRALEAGRKWKKGDGF